MRPRRGPPIDPATSATAIRLIVKDWLEFLAANVGNGGTDPAKEFATRHASARAALAHLEQVLKLSGVPEDGLAEALEEVVAEARAEIANLDDEEMDPDVGAGPG